LGQAPGTPLALRHWWEMEIQPTRSAGLDRLGRFLPRAAHDYAKTRGHDTGDSEDSPRRNVSQLSPWLHAGLLSEAEVCDAVLGEHSLEAADSFISEVFWRIYFKGYLEQRPSIWRAFCEERDEAFARIEGNAGLRTAYEKACAGQTGIEAFDHWARELSETGYLHNHARMWFASIWIFTLKLDWHLGADLFLRHLIDGDAASNTLSWRWVGGLHTKGKTYLARPDNIARYTADHPQGPLRAHGLASEAAPLGEAREHARGPLELPGAQAAQALAGRYALVLHDEAASHVPLDLPYPPALVIAAARPGARSPRPVGERASTFAQGAVQHGAGEAADAFGCPQAQWTSEASLADLLANAGIKQVALPYLPNGWTRDALADELEALKQDGRVITLLSELERATWPRARAGFFGVRKQIGALLRETGIPAGIPEMHG